MYFTLTPVALVSAIIRSSRSRKPHLKSSKRDATLAGAVCSSSFEGYQGVGVCLSLRKGSRRDSLNRCEGKQRGLKGVREIGRELTSRYCCGTGHATVGRKVEESRSRGWINGV